MLGSRRLPTLCHPWTQQLTQMHRLQRQRLRHRLA